MWTHSNCSARNSLLNWYHLKNWISQPHCKLRLEQYALLANSSCLLINPDNLFYTKSVTQLALNFWPYPRLPYLRLPNQWPPLLSTTNNHVSMCIYWLLDQPSIHSIMNTQWWTMILHGYVWSIVYSFLAPFCRAVGTTSMQSYSCPRSQLLHFTIHNLTSTNHRILFTTWIRGRIYCMYQTAGESPSMPIIETSNNSNHREYLNSKYNCDFKRLAKNIF